MYNIYSARNMFNTKKLLHIWLHHIWCEGEPYTVAHVWVWVADGFNICHHHVEILFYFSDI